MTSKTYKTKVYDSYDEVGWGVDPTITIVDRDLKIGDTVTVTITANFKEEK